MKVCKNCGFTVSEEESVMFSDHNFYDAEDQKCRQNHNTNCDQVMRIFAKINGVQTEAELIYKSV